MLIVALAAGLLTQFFPRCAFAIHIFSKVSATPVFSKCFVYVNINLNFKKEMYFPLKPIPKVDVSVIWATGRMWQTKLMIIIMMIVIIIVQVPS